MSVQRTPAWVTTHFWHLWFGVLTILAIYGLYLVISGTPLARTCVQWVNP